MNPSPASSPAVRSRRSPMAASLAPNSPSSTPVRTAVSRTPSLAGTDSKALVSTTSTHASRATSPSTKALSSNSSPKPSISPTTKTISACRPASSPTSNPVRPTTAVRAPQPEITAALSRSPRALCRSRLPPAPAACSLDRVRFNSPQSSSSREFPYSSQPEKRLKRAASLLFAPPKPAGTLT